MVKLPNCNLGSEHATDLILMSIPRFLGTRNQLGPFSDTSDWPEWPNCHLWPPKYGKMAKGPDQSSTVCVLQPTAMPKAGVPKLT